MSDSVEELARLVARSNRLTKGELTVILQGITDKQFVRLVTYAVRNGCTQTLSSLNTWIPYYGEPVRGGEAEPSRDDVQHLCDACTTVQGGNSIKIIHSIISIFALWQPKMNDADYREILAIKMIEYVSTHPSMVRNELYILAFIRKRIELVTRVQMARIAPFVVKRVRWMELIQASRIFQDSSILKEVLDGMNCESSRRRLESWIHIDEYVHRRSAYILLRSRIRCELELEVSLDRTLLAQLCILFDHDKISMEDSFPTTKSSKSEQIKVTVALALAKWDATIIVGQLTKLLCRDLAWLVIDYWI